MLLKNAASNPSSSRTCSTLRQGERFTRTLMREADVGSQSVDTIKFEFYFVLQAGHAAPYVARQHLGAGADASRPLSPISPCIHGKEIAYRPRKNGLDVATGATSN